ncbi:hypothetical protein J9317_17960 [Metabacillus sp. KIGAM252]|uniref:Uncharacterized protein n=2 Tax=Metabacillus flavus TaxID=2823519 RepID=A0ABS5LIS9_9BACI|nr:hypothetical protein [Metabacillus flavus]MBS2970632.1 hypothetical protein [Metabacillus flavus]
MQVVEGIYEQYPELLEKYGETGKRKCREDNEHHLKHLATAYEAQMPKIFTDYAVWLNNVLTSRGMKSEHLIDNFERIEKALEDVEVPEKDSYCHYLKEANDLLSNHQLKGSGQS